MPDDNIENDVKEMVRESWDLIYFVQHELLWWIILSVAVIQHFYTYITSFFFVICLNIVFPAFTK
jgi:hypothetical protein